MEIHLTRGIKDIITEFPTVAGILDEYGIGCGPCDVGICQLKDVVKLHRLPDGREREMMDRIEKTIYPDREIRIEEETAPSAPQPEAIKYSPPIRKLVDEHVLIKRWIALIPRVIAHLDLESETGRQLVLDGVDLIRSFADRVHHGKEEDILFKYFDETGDIFKVMHEDHKAGRGHVKAILSALEESDRDAVAAHLEAYRALLTGHIKKEDEILFPWIDNQLETAQVGELFRRFNEADERIGVSTEKYETFVRGLEKRFKSEV